MRVIVFDRPNKRHLNFKGRSKIVFADDIILYYVENPKDTTKRDVELINNFSKVA